MLMVSTITPATASQDLLEIAVRLVRLSDVINNLDISDWCFFYSLFDILLLFYVCFSVQIFTLQIKQDNQINATKFILHSKVSR